MNKALCFIALITLLGSVATTQANPIDPNLTGDVQTDDWNSLTATTVGTDWNNGQVADQYGSGTAVLNKVTNSSIASGQGIYFTGSGPLGPTIPNTFGGTVSVSQATPMPVITPATIVLQIEQGGALGYEFYNDQFPTLSYNGGNQNLAADLSGLVNSFAGPQSPFGDDTTINTYLLQWDLTGLGQAVNSFEITWTHVQHASLREVRLDQSNTYTDLSGLIIPEPTSLLLLGAGGVLLFSRCRK